jgi:hypothetical protein
LRAPRSERGDEQAPTSLPVCLAIRCGRATQTNVTMAANAVIVRFILPPSASPVQRCKKRITPVPGRMRKELRMPAGKPSLEDHGLGALNHEQVDQHETSDGRAICQDCDVGHDIQRVRSPVNIRTATPPSEPVAPEIAERISDEAENWRRAALRHGCVKRVKRRSFYHLQASRRSERAVWHLHCRAPGENRCATLSCQHTAKIPLAH